MLSNWLFWAILSASFAALTAIFAWATRCRFGFCNLDPYGFNCTDFTGMGEFFRKMAEPIVAE